MTHYAYVKVDLKCPYCDTIVTDLLWFQWGFCPGYSPREDYVYKISDPIHWKTCSDDSIRSWVYFEGGGANIGDPSIKNLIVKDSAQYWLDKQCDKCQQPIAGAALEIKYGIIQKAWLYKPSELGDDADIFVVESDGKLKSMPEWNDHSMETIDNC